ncbi:hypothetical protein V4Y02_23505, partial [Escherichia coli]
MAQVVARLPGMRVARVRSSTPHTKKDVVSTENKKKKKKKKSIRPTLLIYPPLMNNQVSLHFFVI